MSRRIPFKVGALAILLLGLVAWQQSYLASPYTGTFSYIPDPAGIKSLGGSIKWNSSGVTEMQNNLSNEDFDQTAGCTTDDPTGDKLGVGLVITDIPNNGATSYNDCDGPLANVNEEVELRVNPSTVAAGTSYTYDVVWNCNGASVTGDINITFEITRIFTTYDWLDKTSYSACSSVSAPLSPVSAASPRFTDEEAFHNGSYQRSVPLVATFGDPEGLFEVEVLRATGGWLKARVSVDFLDPETFQAYRAFNQNLVRSLAHSNEPVLAVVTFSSPLQTEEVQSLADQAGMEIMSYGAFGSDASGRIWSTYHWPENNLMISQIPNAADITPQGVMVVTGLVNPSSLNMLANDGRVALLDVLARHVQAQMAAEGNSIVLDQIGIPTPAWYILSGNVQVPTD